MKIISFIVILSIITRTAATGGEWMVVEGRKGRGGIERLDDMRSRFTASWWGGFRLTIHH
jgi:hypothetical protein